MLSIDIALYHQETVKMNSNFKTVEAESKEDLVVILESFTHGKKYLYLLPQHLYYNLDKVFSRKDNINKSLNNFIATAFPDENVTDWIMTVEDYGDYTIINF